MSEQARRDLLRLLAHPLAMKHLALLVFVVGAVVIPIVVLWRGGGWWAALPFLSAGGVLTLAINGYPASWPSLKAKASQDEVQVALRDPGKQPGVRAIPKHDEAQAK